MPYIITVTPNPLLNFLTEAPIAVGTVNRVPRLVPNPEGKGLNMARLLATLGDRVTACGFAGGETGALYARLVAGLGVEPAFTATRAGLRVGVMAGGAEGPVTTVFASGFAVEEAERDALLDGLDRLLPGCDLVLCGGSVPDPACEDLLADILARCRRRGVSCWVDSYGPAMRKALTSGNPPRLAKPNRQELASTEGWERAEELHITDGGRGIEVRAASQRLLVHPPTVRECSPVGSGDCYLAALAHARLAGMPLERQVAFAAAAGAANAAHPGVAEINADDIAALVDQVRIEACPGAGT